MAMLVGGVTESTHQALGHPSRPQAHGSRRRTWSSLWRRLPIGSAGAQASEPARSVLTRAIRTVRVVELVGVNCPARRTRCFRERACTSPVAS
jgi:hypothetical protein